MMGPAPALLDRRLLFFTGKGGVGKSTVTAATALLAAEHGKRVLLVEVDAKNNLTALFEHAPVGFEPRQVYPGIYAMQMDTEASLREYLKVQARVPVFGRIGPLARAFDFVATAAPGVKEILTVGKVVWELRESLQGRADWDLIVVDAAATGHVISQLDAPGAIKELVQVGPVRNQTDWMVELLSDPALTALNVVTAAEEMPVNETIELVARARAELDVPLGVVIVNRVLPELLPMPTKKCSKPSAARRHVRCSRSARARAQPRCSTRRGWRCRCGAVVPGTSRTCASRSTCPCC